MLCRAKSPYNVNVLSQEMGYLYFKHIDRVKENIEKIKQGRDKLVFRLGNMEGLKVFPTASNFILVKTESYDKVMEICCQRGISIKGYGRDGRLRNCIRLSVGNEEENSLLVKTVGEALL
jgi:histidinol-phosphate aminotransferase